MFTGHQGSLSERGLLLGEQWFDNQVSLHNRRKRLGEEHFDRPAAEIIQLMTERVASGGGPAMKTRAPKLLCTHDGRRQAVYWNGKSKWAPEGSAWTLEQEEQLVCASFFFCHD